MSVLGLLAAPVHAATDMFLKIPNAPGESADAAHVGDIDVLSFTWGAMNPSSVTGGAGGSAYGVFNDLMIVKRVDKSTAKLLLLVMNGQHQATITFFVRSRGANPVEFLKFTLTNVVIASVQPSGQASADGLTESVSLRFSKIRIDYYPINPDGTAGALVTSNWDAATQTGG